MSQEVEPDIFTMEVISPRHELPIIHDALGRIIAAHSLKTKIIPPDMLLPVSLLDEAVSCFNKKLVSWITDEEADCKIPIILYGGMEKMEDDFTKGSCERIFNAMKNGATKTPGIPALRNYLLLGGKRLRGFRAERFSRLVQFLSRPPYQHPTGFSNKSLEFMYIVNDQLYESGQ